MLNYSSTTFCHISKNSLRIGEGDDDSFNLSGSCDGATEVGISVNSGAIEKIADCSSGSWSTSIDFSSLDDGVVLVEIQNLETPITLRMMKDTSYCTAARKAASPFANSGDSPTGRDNDPFTICTADQFQAIQTATDGTYTLKNNIDFDDLSGGWTQFAFTGILDGNNYQIKNYSGAVSLITTISDGSFIANIHLRNFTSTGEPFLANTNDGQIKNVSAWGAISAAVSTAGLFLTNGGNGVIQNVHVNVTINAPTIDTIGGITSINNGAILQSSAQADLSGTELLGGLVGNNNGLVYQSYSLGTISCSAGNGCGGLIGINNDTVLDSYSGADVTAPAWSGGLIGDNQNQVSRSSSYGVIEPAGSGTGFIGTNAGTGYLNYFDSETSGQASDAVATAKTTSEMQTLTTFTGAGWNTVAFDNYWTIDTSISNYPILKWQQTPSSDTDTLFVHAPYTGAQKVGYSDQSDFEISGNCYDSSTDVEVSITDGAIGFSAPADCLPNRGWSTNVDLSDYADATTLTVTATQTDADGLSVGSDSGSFVLDIAGFCSVPANRAAALNTTGAGSSGSPYIICTATQLDAVAGLDGIGVYFDLGDNLDLTGHAWTPISGFDGQFRGNNFKISNYTDTGNAANTAFFNWVTTNGAIKDTHMRYAHVETSSGRAGILTDELEGSLSNVSSAGSKAYGTNAVGGLVARMSNDLATIDQAWSTSHAKDTGASSIAMLVGTTDGGTITNSFAAYGFLFGNQGLGGLVGRQTAGNLVIHDSWADLRMINNWGVTGGLVARISGAAVSSDIQRSYTQGEFVAWSGGNNGGIVGQSNDNTVNIQESYSTMRIVGGGSAGGIVGYALNATNPLTVTDSYALGNVSVLSAQIGTVCGNCNAANITFTNVLGAGYLGHNNSSVGGFIGQGGATPTVNNSFWDYRNAGVAVDASTATGITTPDAQTETTYSGAGWTFPAVWKHFPDGGGYPHLWWEP